MQKHTKTNERTYAEINVSIFIYVFFRFLLLSNIRTDFLEIICIILTNFLYTLL